MTKLKAGLIIFDLDGTLVDSSRDIAWSANMTLKSMGYDERGLEAIKEHVGWGVRSLLEKLMPREGAERIEEARLKFLEFYSSHLTVDTHIYPGVKETLSFFNSKGKKMAVVTNKPEGLSGRVLAELNLSGYFQMLVGGDSYPNKKPHPEPVEKVLSALGSGPAIIVGDSPTDCEAGKGAGIRAIGVSYGFRPKEELERAGFDLIVGRFTELKEVIE
ncbi:MAG: HAD-IA family hydrolase [Deltaproteobacteria bacterium]|nr:HAD-IA family hydrolase [Deltaproteobacteria bacterium]